MTLEEFWELYSQDNSFWSARTTDPGDDDFDHVTAWEWLYRPFEIEMFGYRVQVCHPSLTKGEWVTIFEKGEIR